MGDEGSYAVKGSIVNADIAEEANIAQDKIAGLSDALDGKVDKVEGKGLSTNDFTNEYRDKLRGIESGAQENVIEHILLNDEEVLPATVNEVPKTVNLHINVLSDADMRKFESIEYGAQVNTIEHILLNGTEIRPDDVGLLEHAVNIEMNIFTDEDKDKLDGIETGAEVNTIRKIYINNTEQEPNNHGEVHLNIGKLGVQGAIVPGTSPNTTEDVPVNETLNKLELARIAKTGLIDDIEQTADTYVILDCGSSTEVI